MSNSYQKLFEKMVNESKCANCGQTPCVFGKEQTNVPTESEHAGEDLSSKEAVNKAPKKKEFKATNGDPNKITPPPVAGKDYVNEK